MIEIPSDFVLESEETPFPDVERSLNDPNGLVAIGGELTTKRLIDAYTKGIFPWYSEGEPVIWYSPNPRMIITKDTLHVSKSLRKTIKANKFEIKINENFEQVIKNCKTVRRKDQSGTWIDNDMVNAYIGLNEQGFAKSIETYVDNKLVGGLYGVSLGKVFFGESMFAHERDASKVAFAYLVENMNYELIDCQVESEHLKSLGAYNIERSAFIKSLNELL